MMSPKLAIAFIFLLLHMACSSKAASETQHKDQVLGDLRRSHLALERATGNSQSEASHQHEESPAPIREEQHSNSEDKLSRSSPRSEAEPEPDTEIAAAHGMDSGASVRISRRS